MNKKAKPFTFSWVMFIFFFVVALGSILHFTYEWSGDNSFVGTFSPINESVWEHLKLLFYPLLLMCFIQYLFVRGNNLGMGIMLGSIIGMLSIIMLFYTYVGAFTHPDSVVGIDITIFVIASLISSIIATYIFSLDPFGIELEIASWGMIVLILALFISFTFKAPEIPLFIDFSQETQYPDKCTIASR